MKRRTILTSVASAAALVLAGHRTFAVAGPDRQQRPMRPRFADLNPDRMWPVYRRYHLLIVGQRDDESGSALAAATVDGLMRFLPTSRAMLVRAADARRVGVLVATAQQDGAIMAAGMAEALVLGQPPLDGSRARPSRVVRSCGR